MASTIAAAGTSEVAGTTAAAGISNKKHQRWLALHLALTNQARYAKSYGDFLVGVT